MMVMCWVWQCPSHIVIEALQPQQCPYLMSYIDMLCAGAGRWLHSWFLDLASSPRRGLRLLQAQLLCVKVQKGLSLKK